MTFLPRLMLSLLAASTLPALIAPAQAYRLSGHAWITERAISEVLTCRPGLLSTTDAFLISLSDSEEDVDLIRKWSRYSHYYHPLKRLDMRRADSSVRVSELEREVLERSAAGERASYGILVALGHVLHHLQDATSPPHVAPIEHGLSDRFEKHEIDGRFYEYEADESLLPCAGGSSEPESDLTTLLTQTALKTLRSSRGEFEIERGALLTRATENSFWNEGRGPAFGSYGELGNSFGLTVFSAPSGERIRIPAQAYRAIWARQLRLAIDSTKSAIYRFARIGAL